MRTYVSHVAGQVNYILELEGMPVDTSMVEVATASYTEDLKRNLLSDPYDKLFVEGTTLLVMRDPLCEIPVITL